MPEFEVCGKCGAFKDERGNFYVAKLENVDGEWRNTAKRPISSGELGKKVCCFAADKSECFNDESSKTLVPSWESTISLHPQTEQVLRECGVSEEVINSLK